MNKVIFNDLPDHVQVFLTSKKRSDLAKGVQEHLSWNFTPVTGFSFQIKETNKAPQEVKLKISESANVTKVDGPKETLLVSSMPTRQQAQLSSTYHLCSLPAVCHSTFSRFLKTSQFQNLKP